MNIELTSFWVELVPENDHSWLISTPIVQPWVWVSATHVGPSANLLLPSGVLVLVGISMAGPAPKMILPPSGFLGEKKKLCVVSPMPVCPVW